VRAITVVAVVELRVVVVDVAVNVIVAVVATTLAAAAGVSRADASSRNA
jgi:hypothetical protein